MPRLSGIFFILGLSFIAVPGTSGFTAEFLILVGAFNANWIYAVLALVGVVLSGSYFLNYFGKAFLGKVKTQYVNTYDLQLHELIIVVPALIIVFWLGLFPNVFLDMTNSSVEHIIQINNVIK